MPMYKTTKPEILSGWKDYRDKVDALRAYYHEKAKLFPGMVEGVLLDYPFDRVSFAGFRAGENRGVDRQIWRNAAARFSAEYWWLRAKSTHTNPVLVKVHRDLKVLWNQMLKEAPPTPSATLYLNPMGFNNHLDFFFCSVRLFEHGGALYFSITPSGGTLPNNWKPEAQGFEEILGTEYERALAAAQGGKNHG